MFACLVAMLLGGCALDRDWPAWGGDSDKTRYSPLKQIDRANVKLLAPAWTFDTGEKGDTQTQPIVAGRVLYAYTPSHKAIALDAVTGRLLWTFKLDGKLLWEYALPYSADATPITYRIDGRQYVAIYASGGKERKGPAGGVYLSFALPAEP